MRKYLSDGFIVALLLALAFLVTNPGSTEASRLQNSLSVVNSTSTALGGGETWTGSGENIAVRDVGRGSVIVAVKTDADGTLYLEQSPDGTNWDSSLTYDVTANINEVHRLTITRPYYRTRYVNGSSAQTYMRLTTMYTEGDNLASPGNLAIGIDGDAIATRPSVFGDEVITGRRAGVSAFTKFGYRTTLTAAGGEEQIWATTGNFTPLTSASTFDIAYTQANDGSSANGAKTLYFVYVDENGERAVATHTLGSDGSDTTSFSGLGINRVAVASSGTSDTNVSDITITATTGGTTQAIVPAGQGVTQQAIYFVASNSQAVAKYLFFNVNKLSGSSPIVTVKGYVYNRAVDTYFEVFRHIIDSSVENTVKITEPVGFALSPTDVLYFVADTDRDNTVITLRFSLFEYEN